MKRFLRTLGLVALNLALLPVDAWMWSERDSFAEWMNPVFSALIHLQVSVLCVGTFRYLSRRGYRQP